MKNYLPTLAKMTVAALLTLLLYLIFNVILRAIASDISGESSVLQIITSFIIMYLLQVVYCFIFIWCHYDRPGLGVKRLMADYKEEAYSGIAADIKKLLKTERPVLFTVLGLIVLTMIYYIFPIGILSFIASVFIGILGVFTLIPGIVGAVLCFALFCVTYFFMLALMRKKWNKEWNIVH